MASQPIHPIASTTPATGKNIVLCCDGTGNQFSNRNSNVVRIYTALDLSDETKQVAYYHPGVGTMGAPTARNRVEKQWTRLTGLAFGAGFRDNVFDVYRSLMQIYEEGDRIFLFGFSRGAYTARALSGLLHGYGLLRRGNEGHLPYAWRAFNDQIKKKRDEMDQGVLTHHTVDTDFAFRETYSHPNLKIHFVGLWDTVSSIGWIYSPLHLLYTAQNPTIVTARHCVSIDERRCFFRDNLYGKPLPGQDIVQVWFPGVHSDVGGSYPAGESFPSNTAFSWLLEEARIAKLLVNSDRINLVLGQPTSNIYQSAPLYLPAPADGHKIHESLCRSWKILEYIPHRYYDWTQRKKFWKVPLGAPRFVPPGSILHPSVMPYLNHKFPGEPAYDPPNLKPGRLEQGATVPFPTAASLAECYTYLAPEPGLPTAAQTLKRRFLALFFGVLDIVIVLLLASLLLFVLASLACGLFWLLRHACECIGQLWSYIFCH